MKFLLIVVAIIAALMIGDAIYPRWDVVCHGGVSKLGLTISPNSQIISENGSSRHVNPTRNSGCVYSPDSKLRRVYEWLVH